MTEKSIVAEMPKSLDIEEKAIEAGCLKDPIPESQPLVVEDPKQWPLMKKVLHSMLPALFGFIATLGTSVYSPGIPQITQQFNVSRGVAVLGIALYSEGLALGPMIGAPLSEALGRRGVYLTTGPLFVLFSLGAALSQNIQTLLICRMIAAIWGSPVLAVGAGSMADIWDMSTSGATSSILFISTIFLGSSVGPTIGGFTFEARHSWRWLMWVVVIAASPLVIAAIFTEETSMRHRQQRAAKKQGVAPPGAAAKKIPMKVLFIATLVRPFKMIVQEPITLAWALYHSFIFGVLFGFFGSYYYVFQTVYHFTASQVGLAFLGVTIGVLLSIVIFIMVDRVIYQKRRMLYPNGRAPPEERMYAPMFGAFCLPISLFWFAWTARSDVHWMSPIAAGVPFGCGMLLLFVGGVTYLMDAYGPMYSASAMAANGMMRYTFGMAFPLFITQMYQHLGIPWATSLLGFISIGLLPIPFVMYKYGPTLRSRSKFAPDAKIKPLPWKRP